MSTLTRNASTADVGIDPRGPRFVAGVSVVLLASALILPVGPAIVLTAVLVVLFGVGALKGVQHTPTSWVFRRLIRPRLGAVTELEDPRPPRFAQAVGLLFAVAALVGFVAGFTLLAQVALGFALSAAVLNAVFGFCLGCEIYLIAHRLTGGRGGRAATVTRPRKTVHPA